MRPEIRPMLLLPLLFLPFSEPLRAHGEVIWFEPSHPTWHDPLTIRLEAVDRGCGLARLTEPEIGREEIGGEPVWVIESEVDDRCAIGLPIPTSVVLTTTVDPIWPGPGEYLVRIRYREGGHTEEADLVVYDPADETLVVPDPLVAADLVLLGAETFDSCGRLDPDTRSDERLVVLRYVNECNILPPGPSVHLLQAEVGPLSPGSWEVVLLDEEQGQSSWERVQVYDPAGCVPSDTRLCLNDSRFAVEATWQNYQGAVGQAYARPLEGLSDSGLMWFFRDTNMELTVKVLNGCALTGTWWVSLASTSDVSFEVTVTDTLNDVTRTYDNELGERFQPIQDTQAFPCL